MPRWIPAFAARWFYVFWNDPQAPVDSGKRVLLFIGAFLGAFIGAFPHVLQLGDDMQEPLKWLGVTVASLCGWGHARRSEPGE